MSRIFLQLGPLTITWYGVMAALGAIAGLICVRRLKKIANMNNNQACDLIVYAMVFGIIGARLFYVAQFWDQFKDNLIEILMIHRGGLVFYGGAMLSIAAVYVFCRRGGLSFISVLDVCAPAVALAHFFGRIGCFLNGCCFGGMTDLPWGIIFPPGSDSYWFYGGPARIHPVQLYEALGNIIIFAALFNLVGRLKKGQTASLYLILYGSLRIVTELFRGDHENLILNCLTTAQFTGIIIVPIGITAFIMFGKRR